MRFRPRGRPGTRDALTEVLRFHGLETRAAASAAEAMEAFESFRPDVLVTDIAMPGEDGYGLIGRVRALGPARGGNLPAVALTALASDDDRRRVFAAGFQAHLAKPTNTERLITELSRLLPERAESHQRDSA